MGIETLAAVSIGTTLAGGAVSAMGANAKADATQQAYQYQAAVARNNKIIADRYADMSIGKGMIQSELTNLQTRQKIGTVRAGLAASGVDVNSGSALDVRRSVAEMGELDAEFIRQKAATEAFGYKVKGGDFAAEAQLDTMKGENARTAGDFDVASSILSTASSVSSKWAGYQNKGTF